MTSPFNETVPEELGNGITLEMVRIPGGEFLMGSEYGEKGSVDSEHPRHCVVVSEFCMGKLAVTQAQYQAVMGTNPSKFKGDQSPVEQVSWNDTQEFCKKLSDKTSRAYRLPSEAEWEYACRAGTTTPFYFGETITSNLVSYNGEPFGGELFGKGPPSPSRRQTTDAGSFPPNTFGLYDMHGNVREWCADKWERNYYAASNSATPWDTHSSKDVYVQRGGSWYSAPKYCRSARRDRCASNFRDFGIGFRVACVVSPARF